MPTKHTHHTSWTAPIIIAVSVVLVISIGLLVIPSITEHRVYVTIGQDQIVDVSAQTVKIPYISKLFPASSNPYGVYTILLSDSQGSIYQLNNVPIGQYIGGGGRR